MGSKQFVLRVDQQNAEYREKLLSTIRERDLNSELLKNVRDERAVRIEELERKLLESASQLKLNKVCIMYINWEFSMCLKKKTVERPVHKHL